MKNLVLFVALLAVGVATHARPLVIEESARIAPPPGTTGTFAGSVGLQGDDAFATVWNYIEGEPDDQFDDQATLAVWLYRKVGGAWAPVRKLTEVMNYYPLRSYDMSVRDGIAAFSLNPLVIFDKRSGDWMPAPGNLSAIDGNGHSVTVDNQRIIVGNTSGSFQGTLIEKDGAGNWGVTHVLPGEYRGGDDENTGRAVGLSGDRAVVLSPYTEEPRGYETPNVSVFRNTAGGWPQEFVIESSTETPFEENTQIHNDEIVVASARNSNKGSFVFRPVNGGPNWALADRLEPLGTFMNDSTAFDFVMSDAYVLQKNIDYDSGGDRFVINVFAKNADGVYEHVATLVASDGGSLNDAAIDGRRVIASCGSDACIYELPASFAQPGVLQETFAGASPSAWTFSAGSQFTIAQRGITRVLRQSETTSPATHAALLAASDWTNQSIEADVRPTAFNGTDRWVGLTTRYRDAGNHYYVTLRASNTVILRKIVDGTFSTLASAPLPVTVGNSYRVRLQSIGKRHRVYVNGVPLLDAFDGQFASGRVGLLTYQSTADFDNVVADPTPLTTVYSAPVGTFFDSPRTWTVTGSGVWGNALAGTEYVYAQTSLAGDARAVVGVPAYAQEVEVTARPTAFASGGTGDKWFGAIARYTNDSNYYYVTVRSGGTISLRKLVDGQIGVLATANLPVSTGTWYSLRLEAVGSRLRVYVNGTLTLEATDAAHPIGQSGMVTYRTAAQFKSFRTIQP